MSIIPWSPTLKLQINDGYTCSDIRQVIHNQAALRLFKLNMIFDLENIKVILWGKIGYPEVEGRGPNSTFSASKKKNLLIMRV